MHTSLSLFMRWKRKYGFWIRSNKHSKYQQQQQKFFILLLPYAFFLFSFCFSFLFSQHHFSFSRCMYIHKFILWRICQKIHFLPKYKHIIIYYSWWSLLYSFIIKSTSHNEFLAQFTQYNTLYCYHFFFIISFLTPSTPHSHNRNAHHKIW